MISIHLCYPIFLLKLRKITISLIIYTNKMIVVNELFWKVANAGFMLQFLFDFGFLHRFFWI